MSADRRMPAAAGRAGADAMPAFEERAPYEAGFAALFAADVSPRIARLEVQRRAALRAAWTRGLLIAGGIGALLYVSPVLESGRWLVFLLLVGGLVYALESGLVGRFALAELQAYRARKRALLLGAACRFAGSCRYRTGVAGSVAKQDPERLGLLGEVDKGYLAHLLPDLHIADLVEGRHDGVDFVLVNGRYGRPPPETTRRWTPVNAVAIATPIVLEGRVEVHPGPLRTEGIDPNVPPFRRLFAVPVEADPSDRPVILYAARPAEVAPAVEPGLLACLAALAEVNEPQAPPVAFDHGVLWLFPREGVGNGAVTLGPEHYAEEARAYLRLLYLIHWTIDTLRTSAS